MTPLKEEKAPIAPEVLINHQNNGENANLPNVDTQIAKPIRRSPRFNNLAKEGITWADGLKEEGHKVSR